jgi:hypothetical protein
MIFNLRRYFQALIRHIYWLPLVLVPLAVFLLIAGVRPDRFTITRVLQVNPENPVAVTTSPVDTVTLRSLVAMSEGFFADRLALAGWRRTAETDPDLSGYDFHDTSTLRSVLGSLSLQLDGQGHCEISYLGSDPKLGTKLVNYYTDRLLSRLRAGFYRQVAAPGGQGQLKLPEHLQLSQTVLKRNEHRAWWRADRLPLALVALLLPLVAFMVFVGFREFLDPSFKSGRQAARYLDLPILGFMPPLDPIVRNLERSKERR